MDNSLKLTALPPDMLVNLLKGADRRGRGCRRSRAGNRRERGQPRARVRKRTAPGEEALAPQRRRECARRLPHPDELQGARRQGNRKGTLDSD